MTLFFSVNLWQATYLYNSLCPYFKQVVGNRGTVDINPRITMQKECIVTGLLLGNASQVFRLIFTIAHTFFCTHRSLAAVAP